MFFVGINQQEQLRRDAKNGNNSTPKSHSNLRLRNLIILELTHKRSKDIGLTNPMAKGTIEALENPARSDVIKVSVPVLAYSYPAKCMALAKAILSTDRDLGLRFRHISWYF